MGNIIKNNIGNIIKKSQQYREIQDLLHEIIRIDLLYKKKKKYKNYWINWIVLCFHKIMMNMFYIYETN